MIRKYLLLFLLFGIFFISACGKKKEITTLKFATWGSQSEIVILKPLINDFEANNPDIKIELMHIPENYFQKIHILFASKMEPDIIFINNLNLPVYKNYLEDLSFFTEEKNFFDGTIKALSVDGKLYAIPRDVSNLVIFYNKDVFKKYGVSYPNENWTFSDFLNKCSKLRTKDTFAISFEELPMFYSPYLMSEGKHFSDLDEINSEDLRFYSDLRKKYNYAPTKAQIGSATMANMFLQGKIAMHLSGRWLVPKYRQEAKFDWDIINFPNGKEGSVVPLDASGWAVSKSSRNKTEAIKFVQFLASKESIEKFTKSGLITPARKDVAYSETFLNKNQKPFNSKVFINIINTSIPTPVDENYSKKQDKLI